MKLNYITVSVRNIEKSIHFYQNIVGLEIIRRFNPGMGEIAFLGNAKDETMLELIQIEQMEKVVTKGFVMSYQTKENLEILREKAIQSGYETTEIIYHPTKPTYFRVLDPDGMTIEFSN